MDLAQAVDHVRPSIVQITFFATDLKDDAHSQFGSPFVSQPLGTGFFVSSDGCVITARHVIHEGYRYVEHFRADAKRLHVGLAQPNTENMRGNFVLVDFEVLDEDDCHDLALLRLKRNPFKGEVGRMFGNVPLLFDTIVLNPERPKDGTAIGISGYPLGQPVLVTNGGWIATSWAFDITEVAMPEAPEWFRRPDIADSYLADVEVNPGNSGGPVYLVENGTVVGLCVASKPVPVWDQQGNSVALDDKRVLYYSSGLTVVVPSCYVIELLRKHGLNWSQ